MGQVGRTHVTAPDSILPLRLRPGLFRRSSSAPEKRHCFDASGLDLVSTSTIYTKSTLTTLPFHGTCHLSSLLTTTASQSPSAAQNLQVLLKMAADQSSRLPQSGLPDKVDDDFR
jgi:hypothetical protein